MKKQEIFNKVYSVLEDGGVLSVELQELAHNHGIRIDSIEKIVKELEEDDCDEEG